MKLLVRLSIVVIALFAMAEFFTWLSVAMMPLPAMASDGSEVLPPAKTVLVPLPKSDQKRLDIYATHYRCHMLPNNIIVLDPVDNLDAKAEAFTCTNCKCEPEK